MLQLNEPELVINLKRNLILVKVNSVEELII